MASPTASSPESSDADGDCGQSKSTSTGAFIGFVGLNPVPFEAPFTPAVEIGWRLARPYWGSGLATEAGARGTRSRLRASGSWELVSFTSTTNLRSQRVMQKLGMRHDPADDFDHPSLPEGHRLRRHVLYRIANGASVGGWKRRGRCGER